MNQFSSQLEQLMVQKLVTGLEKSTITSCSVWAEKRRIMGGSWPGKFCYDHHPWLLEMHDSPYAEDVGQKAAQMGFTEWAINVTFYYMDEKGFDVLYVLPTSDDASKFTTGRFDPALELSPYLKGFFSDVNNVGMKRAAGTILYVRGSKSRSQLKSIPTPVLILDEVDEMPPESISLAKERQSGQLVTKTLKLSTPTIKNKGINADFQLSSQAYYHFQCPHDACKKLIQLTYPECLVITGESLTDPNLKNSYLKCPKCNRKLPHEFKKDYMKHVSKGGTGRFIESYTNRDIGGWHVSQLYSMAQAGIPSNLAFSAMRAKVDPMYAQEWYNSKLGEVYADEGAKISDELLDACIGSHRNGDINTDRLRTFGMDVGTVNNIVIKEWYPVTHDAWHPELAKNDLFKPRTVFKTTTQGTDKDFDEAYEIFGDYKCTAGVLDAEPERRMALRFAQRLFGRMLCCDYLFSQSGRSVTCDEETLMLKVNRTSWLDQSLSRYKERSIELPIDIDDTFREQIKEPTRIQRKDKWGQPYGVYVNVDPDHYAHADCYAEIALPFAHATSFDNETIEGMY